MATSTLLMLLILLLLSLSLSLFPHIVIACRAVFALAKEAGPRDLNFQPLEESRYNLPMIGKILSRRGGEAQRVRGIARYIAALLACSCIFAGCATTGSDEIDYEKVLAERWSKIHADQFSLPETTPYDSNPEHRALFLEGYSNGMYQALETLQRREWTMGDVIHESEESKIYGDGWRAAAGVFLDMESEWLQELIPKRDDE